MDYKLQVLPGDDHIKSLYEVHVTFLDLLKMVTVPARIRGFILEMFQIVKIIMKTEN